ncbi:MAG: TauD/TfdA family dioxygenase [Chromatiales bacterium]|nr:TauD/TfdA family dioxygenase [Chromatiales bacterium]
MQQSTWIDLAPAGSPVVEAAGDAHRWVASQLEPRQAVVPLDDGAMEELSWMVEALRARPLPRLLRSPDEFALPRLRAVFAVLRTLLDEKPGFAVLDALPLDQLDVDEAVTVFWVLGQLIGRTVAQKWDGTMLYDVRDTGQAFGYGVRGSYTNVELVFHTDNAFGVAPPQYVGLLCLRPAKHGGISRFMSAHALHDRLLAENPAALARLYQPLLLDRQAEHAPGAARVARAPMFERDGDGRLRVRANTNLVRKGYAVAGVEIDAEAVAAIAAVEALTEDPSLWVELPIERGQLQYLNNNDLLHFRSAFEDHDDPAMRRHLVRTWHRSGGQRAYDG